MRILVTGSRDMKDDYLIRVALDEMMWEPIDMIVHGGARGADECADRVARELRIPVEVVPADWVTYGRSAGIRRNAEMVRRGADLCLAFPAPKSVGTWDCIRRAAAAGIKIRIYPV